MLFGAESESGRAASGLQSSWSSAGGSTSPVVADDDGPRAASQDSPLTAGKPEKENGAVYMHDLHTSSIHDLVSVMSQEDLPFKWLI